MAAASAPKGTHDDLLVVERVVDVAGDLGEINPTQARNVCIEIWSTGARENRQSRHGAFEFVGEDVRMVAVLKPPALFAPNVLSACIGRAAASTRSERLQYFGCIDEATRSNVSAGLPEGLVQSGAVDLIHPVRVPRILTKSFPEILTTSR